MESGYTITNKFVKPEEPISIIANKVWNDNETQSARRPETITLVVKNGDEEVQSKVVTAENLVAGTTNQWSVEFTGLDKYDANGNEITYTLEEREDSEFYEAEENNVEFVDNQATIRNKFVVPEETVEVQVTKIWNDNNNIYGKRPTSVYLTLTGNGQTYREEVNGEEDNWTHIFENLPKYDENGTEITYTAGIEEVNEGDLEFYSPEETSGDMQEGYEIESGFTVPDEDIELTVNKVWVDNSIQSARRPGVVVINVLGEDGKVVDSYELNTISETSHTFTGLDKYNKETGKEISYTVEEKEKNSGDLHFYKADVGTVTDVDENSKEVTITNTFERPEDTIEVTATKVWADNNDGAEKRPESIMLLLKEGSKNVDAHKIDVDNAVEGDTNRWNYTFTGVDKYDENGQEIVYTADEAEVTSGDLKFYNKTIEGLTVTNTFTQDTSKVNVPVTKEWLDTEIQEARRPESVIIVLKANDEEIQKIELSGEGQADKDRWEYTFENLPKYDELNNIINYTVEEEEKNEGDLKFYSSTIAGTTIINTFTKPTDTISLTVNKVWEDNEDRYGKRPESVKVNVNDNKGIVTTGIIEEDKGWETTLTLAKYDENGQEIKYSVSEEEVTEGGLFFYEGTASGVSKVSENSLVATITNKMVKTPGQVTVRYIDKNTEEEISESIEKEGVVGDTFDVTEDKKEIPGYTLVGEPEEKTGKYTEEAQEKVYYYAKNTNVVVKYLEKDDTPEDNTDNEKLEDEEIISGYEGLAYDASNKVKEVEGYTLVENSGNISGTMTREEIEVIYYYSKNTKVTVKYVDKNTGLEIDNVEPETINGYEGLGYNTESKKKTIEGYTLVGNSENTTGTMTEKEIIVTYYYAKNTNVVVKYLEKDTNKELVPSITIPGYVGKEYETEQKGLSGYTFVEVKGEATGTMTEEEIEVIYYYLQNTKVTVEHIDRETNDIIDTETIPGKVGDVAHTQAGDFEGYVLVQEPENPDIVMDKTGTQVVKYYYAHVSGGVIEKHIDIITDHELGDKVYEGNEGDSYTTSSKEFPGYDLVEDKLPENSSGEMKRDEVIEVKYYYIKRAKVVVKYIDITNGEEKEISREEINGHENDSYTTNEKEITGYSLVGDSGNTEGKMVVTVNEDGTFNIETEVKYYYKKISGGVIVNHIDIETGKVIESERKDGKVGDRYETSSKVIEGYDLVEKDENGNSILPSNSSGIMTEEEIIVNYYYEKRAIVKVQYIDKLTDKILDEEEITGHVGDKYEAEEKEFSGYDIVEKPVNASGEMTEEEIVVKYYYERKAEVEVKYLEKGTEYEVGELEIILGHVGDKYETEAKEVPYYRLVEKTENWEGEMTEEKITVKYYYEKQRFNFSVDKWVESVKVNGISTPAQSMSSSNEIYKIDINRNKADTADIRVTYKIRITNNGEIEGSVGKITEIIPTRTSYYQEDNSIYWDNNNGVLTTDDLKDEVIKPGEYKEIEITLRVKKGSINFGEKENMVILTEIRNPAGFQDTIKEDNTDTSKMIITIATGLDRNDRIIMIGAVQILIAVTAGLLLGYKKKERHN